MIRSILIRWPRRHIITSLPIQLSQTWLKSCQLQTAKSGIATQHGQQMKPLGLGDGLSDEQQIVLDLVLNQRENVFFTGPAGTGKSFLLKKIIKGLKLRYPKNGVAVTASTGLAARNIHGTTLHSFAGIGLGKAPVEKLIADILKSRRFKLKRWKDAVVLIIDEVSMVESTLFDKLDRIAREARKVDQPFGGIQLIITGDFFQLPPVLKGQEDGSPRFCFESKAWKTAIQHTISLTRIYRQRDPVLAGMLNEIREGVLSPTTIATFRGLSRPLSSLADDVPEAVELFPLRHEADAANTRRMQKLKSAVHTFFAEDGGIIEDADARKRLLSDCIAPEVLNLKQGAQVMLNRNIDSTLINGSLGVVIGFFHNPSTAINHTPKHLFPKVRFHLANGEKRTMLCLPVQWAVERWVPPWNDDGSGGNWVVEELATRTQVPLLLAWSLSIHKAQGQTLELVKIDLNRVFERGQAYVALSRATSMDGLQVLNFDPKKVVSHYKVNDFYTSLSEIPSV